jgi:hypothetical protein
MELVYLWVEGYKKFNKQGFNFSPKFICEFKDEYEKDANGNERLKLKCQLFIKPKKHLENFFGDNINITGVVGENGAGKSSLLELLLMINGNRWHHLKSFLFIYRIGNTLYTVPHQITPFLIYDKKSTKVIIDNISNSRDYGSIWINYKHLTNTKEAMMLISIINKQSLYNIHNNEYFISKHIHVYNNYAIVLSHIKDKYFFNTFQVKLKPKKMQNIDKNFKFYELFNKIIMKFYPSQKNMLQIVSDTKPLLTAENQLAYNCFISYVQFYVEYHEQINNDKMKAETFFKNSLENILEYLSIDNTYEIIITELNKFKKLLPKYERNFYLAFENILNNILYLKECLSDFILQDDCYIQNIALINDKKINSLISKTKYLSDSLTVDEYIFNFVDYDFINDDTGINYNNLSDGEKEILNICIDTIHHIDQYKDKNVLLLSNEIDNSLHPNWKKEILSILIKIFHEFIIHHSYFLTYQKKI